MLLKFLRFDKSYAWRATKIPKGATKKEPIFPISTDNELLITRLVFYSLEWQHSQKTWQRKLYCPSIQAAFWRFVCKFSPRNLSLNIYDVQYFISVSQSKTFEQSINKHFLNGIVYRFKQWHTTFIPISLKERIKLFEMVPYYRHQHLLKIKFDGWWLRTLSDGLPNE